MSIQLKGSDDSVYSNDIIAPNIPTQGQIVGYQQGAWTPTLSRGINNLSLISTWARFGNMVTLWSRVKPSDTTTSITIAITGFPYSVPSDTQINQAFIGSTMVANVSPTVPWVPFLGAPGALTFYPGIASTGYLQVPYSSLNPDAEIILTVSYLTDDTTWTPINGATVS